MGGLFIFYSNCLKYYEYFQNKIILSETKTYSDRKFITYCEIDKFRYLISDDLGNLFILAFKKKDNNINNKNNNLNYHIIFQFLGEINSPSSIAFLDNNYFFIGSDKANSQLIKVANTPKKTKNRPLLEIVEEYDNLAPITDFLILNQNNEETNTEILCVSGSQKSCCLKTIRKGTSFSADAELFIPYVKNLNSVFYNNSNHSEKSKNKMDLDEQIENNKNDFYYTYKEDYNHENNFEKVLLFIT